MIVIGEWLGEPAITVGVIAGVSVTAIDATVELKIPLMMEPHVMRLIFSYRS